jgi:hypothetical protein
MSEIGTDIKSGAETFKTVGKSDEIGKIYLGYGLKVRSNECKLCLCTTGD